MVDEPQEDSKHTGSGDPAGEGAVARPTTSADADGTQDAAVHGGVGGDAGALGGRVDDAGDEAAGADNAWIGDGLDGGDGTEPRGALDAEEAADLAEERPRVLLRLEGLEKHYGDEVALGPIDLEVDGRCIGLLGPNGAGKSTLLRVLIGLMHPTAGHAELMGQRVGPGAIGLRRRIGYAPEGEAQFPGLTGVEAVAYAGRLMGMPQADAMQRAHQVLDYVGLQEARYRLVSTYSTGMRQRLKIAQALVHDPEILILDEPTEGVDPQARDEIIALIDELGHEHGIHVILSTHLLADVERLATHAVVLDNGRIVASGSLAELRQGGETGYVVRVVGDPAPLTARLDAAGISWRAVEPELRVQTDDASMLLRHVQEAGLVVRHLAPLSLRLEEAFEHAVGGGDVA